ncbi:MAG: SDR family NAD(P)-dependent oxidoreductase, partial [Pseudoleptotrichia goodfellowii]|nr:SDR family NAD(P)-dependent oxidoreductase [Pseudoleptotrichia goodfellowii]
MKIPFEMDMKDKVIVITGAGGVLCSMFAKALSKTGAKIALLDLNEEAVKNYAEEIVKEGGNAKGYKCNVLDKKSIEEVRENINKELGICDILINGAGGNNPKATTDN